MSSTNRGADKHKFDYYITPKDEIRKFLNAFFFNIYYMTEILDPSAGGDDIHDMAYPTILDEYGFSNVDTCDIREDSRADVICDFLRFQPEKEYELIITNPPFHLALDFVKKGLEIVEVGGYVIMLLRLNFFGTKIRNEWLINNMPKYCFVHGKRMSFTDDGKTDSIEYAHFVWLKGEHPEHTELVLLPY